MAQSPSEVARETLRQLAQRRLAPTPDNYSRVYHEIAAPGAKLATTAAGTMLRELAAEIVKLPGEVPRDALALERAVDLSAWPEAKAALLRLIGGRQGATATPAWGPRWAQRYLNSDSPLTDRNDFWAASSASCCRAKSDIARL